MNGRAGLAPVFWRKCFFIGKHLCQITMPPRGREGAVVDGRRGEGATPPHGFMELVRTGRCGHRPLRNTMGKRCVGGGVLNVPFTPHLMSTPTKKIRPVWAGSLIKRKITFSALLQPDAGRIYYLRWWPSWRQNEWRNESHRYAPNIHSRSFVPKWPAPHHS